MNPIYLRSVLILGCLSALSGCLLAQQLPFRSYTTADGLANNRTVNIFQDKKGFLWFATWEGLSRFDGYDFVNYAVRQGLANQVVNDVAEDRYGRIWAANNDGGISMSIENQSPNNRAGIFDSRKFVSFPVGSTYFSNKVNRILIDSRDRIWCLTDDGLYRADSLENPVFSLLKSIPAPMLDYSSSALFEDARGNVWFAIYYELFEARGGAADEIINHGVISGCKDEFIANAIEDERGRILVLSSNKGLFEFVPANSEWRKLSSDLRNVRDFKPLLEDDNNAIWFGGLGGLLKLENGKTSKYSVEQGLGGNHIVSLLQDREGNLWIGDVTVGINKISDEAVISYPMPAKLTDDRRLSVIENAAPPGENFGNKLLSPSFEVDYSENKWRIGYTIGDKFPAPNPVFRRRDGKRINVAKFFDRPLAEPDGITFYDDADGRLWFSKNDGFIYRTSSNDAATDSIEEYRCEPLKDGKADFIIGDRQGGLWIFRRGVKDLRLRNGACEHLSFNEEEKAVTTDARSVFLDSRGWLWIGTRSHGVAVAKNPAAGSPTLKFYTTDDGLSSQTVWSIAEDDEGRMYFGTGRGLNRFDPQGGLWQSLTTRDGLTGDLVNGLHKDSDGNLWIITPTGVSKLDPDSERKNNFPPPVYISRVNIAGENLPLPETGFAETAAVELDSLKNDVKIDFVGLQFKGENVLNYQYKLEGVDEEWSKPDKSRTIAFANLASGNYRFLVRAINQENLLSAAPAAFEFRILPPIYLRPWFVAAALFVAGLTIYSFYHFRLQRLLEIERARMLIATDLHDDIGANLSKISVLSEVVRMRLNDENAEQSRLLNSIAETSRQSVGAMRDIVWAINPKRDSLIEMIRKMREHAEEIFAAKNIRVAFVEPAVRGRVKLPMHLRRELYLIFKEAVNNVAKHSECARVEIDFQIKRREIALKIADDGKGFDPQTTETGGNGLSNMRARVNRLQGVLEIESAADSGTTLLIRIPHK